MLAEWRLGNTTGLNDTQLTALWEQVYNATNSSDAVLELNFLAQAASKAEPVMFFCGPAFRAERSSSLQPLTQAPFVKVHPGDNGTLSDGAHPFGQCPGLFSTDFTSRSRTCTSRIWMRQSKSSLA